MRTIAVASIMFASLVLSTAGANAAPWCAQYGGRGGGGTNCGFYSFAQCMAAVSGVGGFCTRNYADNGRSRGSRRRY